MNWQLDWQLAAATLLVAGCAAYALWPLLPATLRQRWRKALGLAPRSSRACGGCDGGCTPPAARPRGKAAESQGSGQVIRFVRRPPG